MTTTPDKKCRATCSDGSECEAWAMENGRCRHHGGKSTGPKTETGKENVRSNSVSHGLYSSINNFYQDVMNDRQRALCDEIFQDYCTRFRDVNGEPNTGEQARLFEIAVNHIKIIHSDNWAVDKPSELESGNPMVDKGQRYNTEGVPYQEYAETVVLKGQTRLRNSDRQWLKDYNLLYDGEDEMLEMGRELGEIARTALED